MSTTSIPCEALIGLYLVEAQARLADCGQPFLVREAGARPSRAAAPVWGEWRVTRVRNVPAADGVEHWELLVAREMLRDERAPRESAPHKSAP